MDGKAERFLLIVPPEQADSERPAAITVILNQAQSLGQRRAPQGY